MIAKDLLKKILKKYSVSNMDAHVHTHLDDGGKEMTVQNIAQRAKLRNIELVCLTPHFHKKLYENNKFYYWDTDPVIFKKLKREIDILREKPGMPKILLSSEVDILNINGDLSIKNTDLKKFSFDYIMPTLNFHPMLPLWTKSITAYQTIKDTKNSEEWKNIFNRFGGSSLILRNAYRCIINAARKCPFTFMIGHFLNWQCTFFTGYSWFGINSKDINMMKEMGLEFIEVLKTTGGGVDITGLKNPHSSWMRAMGATRDEPEPNSDLRDYHLWIIHEFMNADIPIACGSDSHTLEEIGDSRFYREYYKL